MAQTPRGQFRIQLPDGLIIERLPVGVAKGETVGDEVIDLVG